MNSIERTALRITCLGLLLGSLAAQAEVRPVGPELRIDQSTASHQRHPALAGEYVGTFLVTWTSEEAGGHHVYGRCRYSDGELHTPEFRITGEPILRQAGRSAVAYLFGDFMVVWEGGSGIRAQRLYCDGRRNGEEILVSVPSAAERAPAIARDPHGNPTIVWESHSSGEAPASRIMARRLDRSGNTLSGFEVSPPGSALQTAPRAAISRSGELLVTWLLRISPGWTEVWARRFDAAGSPMGAAFRVSGASSGERERPIPLTGTGGGGFSVLWQDGGAIAYQRFGAAGERIGEEGRIELAPAPRTASAAVDPFGNVLLLWDGALAEVGSGVFGRYFDGSLRPVTPVFRVNTSAAEEPAEPVVAFDGTGDFFAVWSGRDGDASGVFGQRFDEVAPLDPEVLSLHESRFQVRVSWNDTRHQETGVGRAIPLSRDSGAFWFFQEENLELMIKVLDGRSSNGHFWVFYGSLSDVEYEIEVTDTATGASRTYRNPPFQLASHADTHAFAAPPDSPAAATAGAFSSPAPSAWRVPAGRVWPETQVNVQASDMQRRPSIASDSRGNVLIAWESWHFPGIRARLYDAAGNPRGGEIEVSSASGHNFSPRVASGSEGFLIAWQRADPVPAGTYVRAYDHEGRPLGDETLIGPALGPGALAADREGGFVAVWLTAGRALLARQLDSRGRPAGALITVDGGLAQSPVVAAPPSGGFWVAWNHSTPSAPLGETHVRRYSAAGELLGSHVLTGLDPRAFMRIPAGFVFHENGEASLVGFSTSGTFVQRFSGSGGPIGSQIQVPSPAPSRYGAPRLAAAAGGPSGHILLVWPWGDDIDLYGRLFDASWQPAGPFFRLNTFQRETQDEVEATFLPDGDFIAVWGSGSEYPEILPTGLEGTESQDGSFFGVFAQRFRARCLTGDLPLCLQNSRFEIEVSWRDPRSGATGRGTMVPLSDDTGAFWFFQEANLELMVKVLDGRTANGHFWVFYGALSDVEYTLRVLDTATGAVKTYHNPPRTLASRADTRAFPSE